MSKISESGVVIDGIEVKFPFHPYRCQRSYMENVIKTIKESKNALLESPTGTGKTLSLLCSTIATLLWNKMVKKVKKTKDDIIKPDATKDVKVKKSEDGTVKSEQLEKESEKRWADFRAVSVLDQRKKVEIKPERIKIMYSSRTHSQLKQVIGEVWKSDYYEEFNPKGLKGVLLASRDLLCINPSRGKMTGEVLANFCKQVIQERKCEYFNTMRGDKNAKQFQFERLMDIEEMVQTGKDGHFCPYFSVKEGQEHADLVLLPYNYILSPDIRDAMDIDIKDSIIIIDEAHNAEQVAEEGASFGIKQTDIGKFIEALRRFATFYDDYLLRCPDKLGENDIDFVVLNTIGMCLQNTDEFLTNIILLNYDNFDTRRDSRDHIGIRWLIKELNKDHLVYTGEDILKHMYESMEYDKLKGLDIDNTINKVVGILTKGTVEDNEHEETFMQHYNERMLREDCTLLTMLRKFTSILLSPEVNDYPEYYNVIITNDEKFERLKNGNIEEIRAFGWNKKFKRDETKYEPTSYREDIPEIIPKVFTFKCLQPVPTFVRLKNGGVRSIILTSGTLGPLEVLERHLGGGHVKFDVKLQNEHVIDPSRVWVGAISGNAEDPNMLSSTFNTRNKMNYITELGNAVLSFVKNVPGGVLVFFGSYSVMNYTASVWKKIGIYSKIEMFKRIYLEARPVENPDDKDAIPVTTMEIFEKYKQNIDQGNGSVFFAICRGRLAEGIDFSDDYCRGIFVCGIPYPSRFDDNTALKMDYLDKLSNKTYEKSNLANEWYTSQAIRAINQAVGRSIRHDRDYGAILLADYRFKHIPVKPNLSKWVLNRLKLYTRMDECIESLSSFFEQFDQRPCSPTRLIKKATHELTVPIKTDYNTQFKSREASLTSKNNNMPMFKSMAKYANSNNNFNHSLLSYASKPKTSQHSLPDFRLKDGPFSFKPPNKSNFGYRSERPANLEDSNTPRKFYGI
ncbi:DNA repair helicase (rad3) family protein [Theileria parva strain Muguga]|uniref:DNA repair helicase, putative n=1 Tax=Theileria parva TaxID=5875 RepID=Q4N1G0_THEPA|nr:DNA repair helicase (rad3) family protein [Theileria parva strain Muguga]EAN32138.1 DNA repair helicase (rad3) family protein [Theileria parva strain Muguga]|eukprot:XP_764421.1 DNA repair helicase [Theileria parva strain Muguga]